MNLLAPSPAAIRRVEQALRGRVWLKRRQVPYCIGSALLYGEEERISRFVAWHLKNGRFMAGEEGKRRLQVLDVTPTVVEHSEDRFGYVKAGRRTSTNTAEDTQFGKRVAPTIVPRVRLPKTGEQSRASEISLKDLEHLWMMQTQSPRQ